MTQGEKPGNEIAKNLSQWNFKKIGDWDKEVKT